MLYCINCGAEVSEEDKVCRDCGYDPKVRGLRIIPDYSSLECVDLILKSADSSASGGYVICMNCKTPYRKTLLNCPICNERNIKKYSSLINRMVLKVFRKK